MVMSRAGQGPSGGTLTEVLELILDRGVVIDAFVRVSLVGIEVLTIDARVVVASIDTYLRYAEAVGRINLDTPKAGVPELLKGKQNASALGSAVESLGDQLGSLLSHSALREPREGER